MSRIIAFDVGKKRIGIAVTDPLKIIANRLTTVQNRDIFEFLKDYLKKENVCCFVVGLAKQRNNKASESTIYINLFVKKLKKIFPNIPIEWEDERFTSKIAFQTMIDGGLKRKRRQDKKLIDGISATIILQSYLERKSFKLKN